MIKEISIQISPDQEKDSEFIKTKIFTELKKNSISFKPSEVETVFVKKSIDARHKNVKLFMRYKVYIGEKPGEEFSKLPEWKNADGKKSVIIVGSGPAGLFGAFKLLEYGIKPIIVERGSDTSTRKRDIAAISTKGVVDGNSNYCFGEGGAGTFSDGKLYTRSNKRGDISSVLKIFANFGADKKILTDAHPHIGTDRLPAIINSMREFIISKGGEFHFDTKCVDLIREGNAVLGIRTENTKTKEAKEFRGNAVVLATGHSAPDIYKMIAKLSPESLEAKTFAVGVRAEHPRTLIDAIRFHGKPDASLGAAEYRFTTQQKDRGVYSFCMCPGGFVVPSQSGPDQIVVNGMSASGRNSKWSNAAVVVETRPEDIPGEYVNRAKELGCPALAGLLWRDHLEKLAADNGKGQKAPAQRIRDFVDGKESTDLPETSYTPGIVSSRLDQWIPKQIAERLAMCFKYINRDTMKGYLCDDGLLIALETRTSTPVRIVRSKYSFECVGLANLYPCGEGSGYSGGIVSSAMDGENACVKIAEKLGC